MNEALFIIVALALLILPKLLLSKVKHPYDSYIKFVSALLLLLLVWLPGISVERDRLPFKLIITVVVLYEFYKNILSFRKQNAEQVN